jgi:deoxyguanosine kinase
MESQAAEILLMSTESQDDNLRNHVGQKPQLISIEGNIGSGKSSLLRNLSDKHKVIPEPVEDWGQCLTKYYEEPRKHAYELQMKAMASYKQSVDNIKHDSGFVFIE